MSFACLDQERNGEYLPLCSAIASLSGLFSESDIPYINYRVAENIFCRSFKATNLSRSDTAFDAQIGALGIGLKTFVCNKSYSIEKIAEFNALSAELSVLRGVSLAKRLAQYRNERIQLGYDLYNITSSLYHIVARRRGELVFFETDYSFVDLDSIHDVKASRAGITFADNQHQYTFNASKSTLFRRFDVPTDAFRFPVQVIDNPYDLLLRLRQEGNILMSQSSRLQVGKDYVVLPLYSSKGGDKYVPERSGLNQWNAQGRPRDPGEVYIPVPSKMHRYCPDFFPSRDQRFELHTPDGEVLTAKLCQDGAKALMTDPNKALSDWLLRKVFRLQERELLTYERMRLLDIDCVYIYKRAEGCYSIDKAPIDTFDSFVDEVRHLV